MEFRVLGPVELADQGRVVPVDAAKQRELLALLLLRPNRTVGRDWLMDQLWRGDPPPAGRTTLQAYVYRLRRLLRGAGGSDALVSRPGGYLLAVPEGALDAERFGRSAAAGREALDAGRFDDAVDALRAGVGLWRGPAFADIDLAAVRDHARALEDQRLEAIELCLTAELAAGRHAVAVVELDALVEAHPLRERLWELLLLALHRCGRRAEALAAYRRLHRLLDDELGIQPSAPVRRLQRQILSGDTAWEATAPQRTGREEAQPVRARPPASDPVPRQLPAGVGGFTGREARLSELDELLASSGDRPPGAVVVGVISGMAGVGKTALAVHWAHQVTDHFPDGQLYVNLRGFDPDGPPLPPEAALRGFLDALGVPPERIPPTAEAQIGLYRSAVADKRLLLLLDNAFAADQVRPLLPAGSGSLVLVTSRDRLSSLIAVEHARPVPLHPLTDDEARQFLTRRLGDARTAAEPDAVQAIVDACARLPLALAVATTKAATGTDRPLFALAAALQDTHTSLDSLAGDDPTADVRAVFSWSYRSLGEEAARLFRLLGLHHGPDISAAAVASLAALAPGRARRLLAELARAHLVSETAPGRYALHDLLRAYAIELSATVDSREKRNAAAFRLLSHYVHTAHAADRLVYPGTPDVAVSLPAPAPGVAPEPLADRAAAMDWFEAEYASIAAVALHARGVFDAQVWQLAWSLHHFLSLRGRVFELTDVQHLALSAAQRTGDAAAQAHAHRVLAWCGTRLGRLDDSRSHLTRALDLSAQAGDLAGEAAAHRNLSHLAQRSGDAVGALAHSHQALALYRKAQDRFGEARALNSIGWYHAQLGEHEDARRCCEEALRLCLELDYTSLAASECGMRTIVITGGTDGMGAALARHYLAAGDRVVVIGRSRAKFEALTAAAGEAAARAEFIAADLSLLADNRRVVEHLLANHERIDALVLAASFVRQRRTVTAEGREASWALFFLGKYLLVTGLAPLLRASGRPVVVNTAVPGAPADAIDFDDLEMTEGFTFKRSNAQQRRANELLGILATADDPNLAYVTWGPTRLVRTSFAGDVGKAMAIAAAVLGRLLGQSPDAAVRPIVALIDDPAPGRAAYRGAAALALTAGDRDDEDAARLAAVLQDDLR
ncbi:AfsR/SARP family transcriptional regulator [Glycomyces terrestris]|uniref:AfsR/SARP family transcriptional regulator n=1 Tax=Glycomyces terrestris TaxID=2493553 RepID=UPI001315172D|nr:SDR family NAD(P)-dependent oxidoreductase [Glycomyces terrestris]